MIEASEGHPFPDQIYGAPHPAETQEIFGQEKATQIFLSSFFSGRLHHSWILTGPKGIGKATLAWNIAKFLFVTPSVEYGASVFAQADLPTSIKIEKDHPVARRIKAGSEPGLFLLRRSYDEKRKNFRKLITVDEVRKLKSFFRLSAPDGGRRIAIVDSVDEMNQSAANAILKILEEPPKNTFLFLISHQPGRLLPTIKSRCRELTLDRLNEINLKRALEFAEVDIKGADTHALTLLSGGSVASAIKLVNKDGLLTYKMVLDVFSSLPNLKHDSLTNLLEKFSHLDKTEDFEFFTYLLEIVINRLTINGVKQNLNENNSVFSELSLFPKLCPNQAAAIKWATLAQKISRRMREGHTVNLDPSALILDTFVKIEACAVQTAQ